jgi:hypothetical protein
MLLLCKIDMMETKCRKQQSDKEKTNGKREKKIERKQKGKKEQEGRE